MGWFTRINDKKRTVKKKGERNWGDDWVEYVEGYSVLNDSKLLCAKIMQIKTQSRPVAKN